MVEVFLLGAAIALVRLEAWMQVDLGPALLATCGFALCSLWVDGVLDRAQLWQRAPLWGPTASSGPERGAASPRLMGCSHCQRVAWVCEGSGCRRCDRAVHARKPGSVGRTWAAIVAASLLAIPANALPVMTVVTSGHGGPRTILGGTLELAENGFWGLAVVVFVASIVVPLVKLGVLCTVLLMTGRRSPLRLRLRTRLIRAVALVGRWSMLDVFATMILVALARFGWIGSVTPGPGASAFCGVVLLTLLAMQSFDSRLMWDAAGKNPHREPSLTRSPEVAT
jgi:paraquat-inducible protein A